MPLANDAARAVSRAKPADATSQRTTGAGWVYKAKGNAVVREAAYADPGQERCVGPFAFAKGPLAMLSAPLGLQFR